MAIPRPQPLQDAYLAEVKRQAVPVTIYLVNGFQLRGVVKGFDPFTIVLEFEKKAHLIYKHAVRRSRRWARWSLRCYPRRARPAES